MPSEAFAVHGIGDEMLADKPVFAHVVTDFVAFIADAPLVIHNAAFDMAFLNAELGWAGYDALPAARAIDTLAIARRKFPGSPVSLDALCRRFGIDLSIRDKHGALLDATILADVYLELIGGKQAGLALHQGDSGETREDATAWRPPPRPRSLPGRLSDAERAAHEAFLEDMGGETIWTRLASGNGR
jgi:DNA polymerase-3 subunit epsilon